jgi:DNA-binding GntR family transcriptional regulator
MPKNAVPRKKSGQVTTLDVIEILREHIRLGRLVPGQRLVEVDIVRETGASRGKVREALKKLETEGIVSIEEFRGASVRQLSMDEVRQIYKTRMALEGLLAGEFAESANETQKKNLQQIQAKMDALENSGDHRRFGRLNHDWHLQIIEGSGNQYAAHFLTQLTVPVYQLLFTSFYSSTRIADANADHKIITRAILEGKASVAEKTMRQHIKDALGALIDMEKKRHNDS